MLTFEYKINNLTKAQLLGGWGGEQNKLVILQLDLQKKIDKKNSD
jgi:hypothetical protein